MSNMLEDLLSQLGPGGVSKIAGSLGSDQSATSKAIGLALPALLGGLARNASQPQGAESLASALDDHGDGMMGQLAGLLGGSGILGHVLGGRQEPVAQQVAKGSGMDMGSVMKLLPILAPIVMGYLSRQKKQQNLGAADIGSMLRREREEVEQPGGMLGKAMAAMLDDDGDGVDLGDIMGALTGGGGGQSSGLGGMLGKMLSGG